MLDAGEVDRQNALWRIDEYGPGAELVRQCEVERLQALMKPFYSHGSLSDIFVLRIALEQGERFSGSGASATLVESFLAVLGIDPSSFLAQSDDSQPLAVTVTRRSR